MRFTAIQGAIHLSEIVAIVGASAASIIRGSDIVFDANDDSDIVLLDAGVLDGSVLNVSDLESDAPPINVIITEHPTLSIKVIFTGRPAANTIPSSPGSDYFTYSANDSDIIII